MNSSILACRGRKTLLKVLPAAIMMGLAPCVYAAGGSAAPASPVQSTSQKQSRSSQSQSKNKQRQSAVKLGAIVVTGLRNSLESSMNVKRDAIGFVDAITAEAIGKFPDTNIAGALQRIPGVSINRRQGAGAQVTVRGFGPGFNMVMVDGRRVPGADGNGLYGGGTRAFDFAELSADDVNQLIVHKTGRANIDGGGIGATINIITDKPFFHKGGKVVANFSAKGIYDTSRQLGNTDVTPAYSALFSYANPDKTWGVELNFNYEKRKGGSAVASENGWNTATWTGSDPSLRPGVVVKNPPKIGQLYSLPNDMEYSVNEFNTKRTNGHIVFQLQPIDGLTITADDLFSRYTVANSHREEEVWFQRAASFTALEFNTGKSAVASPVFLRDVPSGNKDIPHIEGDTRQKYKLDSYGLNLKWQVNDNVQLAFDAHDTKNSSLPDLPGGFGSIGVGVASTNNCTTGPYCGGAFGQAVHFNGGLPIMSLTWYPTREDAYNNTNGTLNPNFGINNIGSETVQNGGTGQGSELKEYKFDGIVSFSQGQLQFGADSSTLRIHQFQYNSPVEFLGGYSVDDAGKFPDLAKFLVPIDFPSHFDGYPTEGAMGASGYYVNPKQMLAEWVPKHYPNVRTTIPSALSSNNFLSERTKAFYAQVTINGNVGSFPTTTRFGLRYAWTDVNATAFQATPSFVWDSNNDFTTVFSSTLNPVHSQGSYSNLLPNVDFDIQLTDSLVGRISYSKTIARVGLGSLYAGSGAGAPSGSVLVSPTFQATGSSGNTGLKPLDSSNIDIGLGWYFAPASYISATLWFKRVNNFVGSGVTTENLFGLRDMTSGPRAKKAAAFLASAACKAQVTAAGFGGTGACDLNNTTLFTAMGLAQSGAGFAAYNGSSAQASMIEDTQDIKAQPDDPLYQFAVSRPVNKNDAHMHGLEIDGQYFLGQTGFGVQANYSLVRQNIGVKPDSSPAVNQFAVTGLSDSANIVGIYQKYGWSVRLAWAWRSHYLVALNQYGPSRSPQYMAPYHELDLSVSHDFNKHLSIMFSGINLNGEDIREYSRSTLQIVSLTTQKPRYSLALRYQF